MNCLLPVFNFYCCILFTCLFHLIFNSLSAFVCLSLVINLQRLNVLVGDLSTKSEPEIPRFYCGGWLPLLWQRRFDRQLIRRRCWDGCPVILRSLGSPLSFEVRFAAKSLPIKALLSRRICQVYWAW